MYTRDHQIVELLVISRRFPFDDDILNGAALGP